MADEKKENYWVSWWCPAFKDWPKAPWKFWKGGEIYDGTQFSICALIPAVDEDDVWKQVAKSFPNYEERFCNCDPEMTHEKLAEGGRFT